MNNAVKQLLKLAENCNEQDYIDAVRIRVAEIDGFTSVKKSTVLKGRLLRTDFYGTGANGSLEVIPDYPQDLNAVARVEGKLSSDGIYASEVSNMEMFLARVVPGNIPIWRATALQRCEAIILTWGGKK